MSPAIQRQLSTEEVASFRKDGYLLPHRQVFGPARFAHNRRQHPLLGGEDHERLASWSDAQHGREHGAADPLGDPRRAASRNLRG